jgi:MFS family permease
MAGSARGLRPTASDLDRTAGAPDPGTPPRTGQRGLDWFNFFVADIQTGFGPFLSVYLTTQKWTQVDIGLVLSIGSIVGLLAQVPGGWVVDLARSKLRAAGLAVIAIGLSALLIALAPTFLAMVAAKLLHVGASSVLGPAIAAITLGLVGHAAVAARLGRNARFSAIGNGLAAAVMGACGYFISPQAVFLVTAALAIPAQLALNSIPEAAIDPVRADGGNGTKTEEGRHVGHVGISSLLRKQGLLVFTLCILLFHLANAAMLPLVGSDVTMRSSRWATALVAACIIAPQLVVAAISPKVGELAQDWGRRPLLLIGFGVLPLRGALLAWTSDPYMIVAVQALDGVSGAVLGVLVPLTLADVSRGTGRFNLAQGIVGCATGVGASLSTIGAGVLADKLGTSIAFAGLAAVAVLAFAAVALLMPETRSVPRQDGKV